MNWSSKQYLRALGLLVPIAALPLFCGAAGAQDNYTLPAQPTAHVGINYFYSVPIGYTWDHLSYATKFGDWNVAIGDTGFDAGEIPNNPYSCGPNGDKCPPDAGAKGPSFITKNNDPLHGYTGIPLLIGPTQDGFNNVITASGQAVPVVPGKYKALYVAYSGVCGPHQKPIVLNYSDGVQIIDAKWADWCSASQAPPDFFTWAAKHRMGATAADNASCALITKFVPVNPNRTLNSVTLGFDQRATSTAGTGNTYNQGGWALPGDEISNNCGRTVIGCVTLVSTDANLGTYGLLKGVVKNSDGTVATTPEHNHAVDMGVDVFVVDPPLGNYGAGVSVDGSYTLGLPPGTYKLSAAVRGGTDTPDSQGPQANLVTVTIEAGKTATQDITLLASPKPDIWGELTGTVKDSTGKAVKGATILVSNSATGPFAAIGASGQGVTLDDGLFDIKGLGAGTLYVKAATNGSATADAVKVTLAGGAPTTQDLTVAALPIGSILGTVKAPDGTFGGIGVPVKLASKDGSVTLNTTTYAMPLIAGSSIVPEDTETATFNFDAVPAGDYTLTLVASAFQGADAATDVTVKQGDVLAPALKLTFAPWSEGTADTTVSDPLTGSSLATKWTALDLGTLAQPGSVKAAATGLSVTTGGAGWDVDRANDAMTYVFQKGIPQTDWAAMVTVVTAPTNGTPGTGVTQPGGEAGIMVRSAAMDPTDATLYYGKAANFSTAITNGMGVNTQGRVADGLSTFPFQETSAGTNPANATTAGVSPALPVMLKIRKVGPTIAAFWSNDGGKTQFFSGAFLPQFDPAGTLLLGLATTANSDTADTAVYKDFVFAPLTGTTPPPVTTGVRGDMNGDGKLNITDVVTALRGVAGLVTLTADQLKLADVNGDGKFNITDVVLMLRKVAGLITKFPGEA
ncbi:MAG TPA: carboxypeptidase regulatory-like domain-containing protein [Armatimonadota bacterium]|jgi:hypothetical protein